MQKSWSVTSGEGPVMAAAIHAGHDVHPGVSPLMAVSDADRLREEDPYTDRWTRIAPSRVVVHVSRFEVDMNRSRETCVYRTEHEAWGIRVWKSPPDDVLVDAARSLHDAFYRDVSELVLSRLSRHERIVVLDLHSYCHRRGGPGADPADPAQNPEVNVGTDGMDALYRPLADRFMRDLRGFDFGGRALDVRENVKFRGGHFPTWLGSSFGGRVCPLAVEIKKTFMDEWTGLADEQQLALVGRALASTLEGMTRELARL